ncbi:hypothetical protein [Deminuibacter soli]|nr:hypothetical protein [Deminuibacter soli]
MRKIVIVSLLLWSRLALSQTESIHLHLDKQVAYASDTLWFKSYVVSNAVNVVNSTLYAELYTDAGKLVFRKLFPIIRNNSLGQLVLPNMPGLYWLRSYTKGSLDDIQSITVADSEKIVVRSFPKDSGVVAMTDSLHLTIISKYEDNIIRCSLFPDTGLFDRDSTLYLTAIHMGDTIARQPFFLKSGHWRVLNLPIDSLHGNISLLYSYRQQLWAKHELFIPSKPVSAEIQNRLDTCSLIINDTSRWNYSLTVIDAATPYNSTTIIHAVSEKKNPEDSLDYLSFQTTFRSIKKKKLYTNMPIIVGVQKGNTTIPPELMSTDTAGRVNMKGIYFFDTAYVYYIPGNEKKDLDVQVVDRGVRKFSGVNQTEYRTDTIQQTRPIQAPVIASPTGKIRDEDSSVYLQGVTVTTSWQNKNKWLDKKYTTNEFTWPSHFNFNLMDKDATKDIYSISDYLKRNLMGFEYDAGNVQPEYHGKAVSFFLDEQPVGWSNIKFLPIKELAYAKVIEDYNRYGKNDPIRICIYRRKGDDIQEKETNMKKMMITGYTRPLNWTQPDRITYLWVPYIHTNTFSFKNPGKKCRVIVEGISDKGDVIQFQKVINDDSK